jgi:hypothetical protein
LQGFLLQVEVFQIILHEAGEPNAVVDLMPSFWPASTFWRKADASVIDA